MRVAFIEPSGLEMRKRFTLGIAIDLLPFLIIADARHGAASPYFEAQIFQQPRASCSVSREISAGKI
jgi:hypothetical protein